MVRRESQHQKFREKICRAVQASWPEAFGSEAYKTCREEVTYNRRKFEKKKLEWEKEYWDQILNDAKDAQETNNYGKKYKLLTKLGTRENKSSAPSEIFTANDLENQFKKVSETRNDLPRDQIEEVIQTIPDRRGEPKLEEAAKKLGRETTTTEVMNKWNCIKENTPEKTIWPSQW